MVDENRLHSLVELISLAKDKGVANTPLTKENVSDIEYCIGKIQPMDRLIEDIREIVFTKDIKENDKAEEVRKYILHYSLLFK